MSMSQFIFHNHSNRFLVASNFAAQQLALLEVSSVEYLGDAHDMRIHNAAATCVWTYLSSRVVEPMHLRVDHAA